MARNETDREDLMREAVALKRRMELRLAEFPESVVVGFRDDGQMSAYFGPDPVYHFDAAGRLRRAYAAGRLFRTQGATLAQLTRHRQDEATVLQRCDLTTEELAEFETDMRRHLEILQASMANGAAEIIAGIPNAEEVLQAFSTACETIESANPWLAPAIAGKR